MGLASTGFNHSLINKKDDTLHATTSNHGCSTIQRTAKSMQPTNYMVTTARASYARPSSAPKPNWSNRDAKVAFEPSKTLNVKLRVSDRLASGFASNRQTGDSTGWVTEKNMHSDMVRSTYRESNRIPKTFHKATLIGNTGRLPRKEKVYD